MPSDQDKYADSAEYALWCKYEDVAMHFNDLLMRLRSQALAALATVVTVAGSALAFARKPSTAMQWPILFGTIAFLTLAWAALMVLDIFYYDKLLRGAVEALVLHERRTPTLSNDDGTPVLYSGSTERMRKINLSTHISAAVPRHYVTIRVFYGLVLVGLLVSATYAGKRWASSPDHVDTATGMPITTAQPAPHPNTPVEASPPSAQQGH